MPSADVEQRAAHARPRIAITHGDPNGIGPEVVIKALEDERLLHYVEPILVGSAYVMRRYLHQFQTRGVSIQSVTHPSNSVREGTVKMIDVLGKSRIRVTTGAPTKDSGELSVSAIKVSADLAVQGAVDAVVTGPISKHATNLAGFGFPGHTEYFAERTGARESMMVMVSDVLCVGLVTVHVSLASVSEHITQSSVSQGITQLNQFLVDDVGMPRPKIAVLGLNPHAGDHGLLGTEDDGAVLPAIKECCRNGLLAFGPFPADGFFGSGDYRQYDAVLAMYHDQGLIPFKLLSFGGGVNVTAGLPIVRTSPDHGTAYAIAGRGEASARSLRKAIFVALDIVRRRQGGLV